MSEVSGPFEAGMPERAEGAPISFDRNTVDLDVLQRAAYALAADMTIDIRANARDYACSVFPRRPDTTEAELHHRFRAEVNDQILRVRIAQETEPLRNLIFALAFSQTGLIAADGGEEP